MKLSWKLFFLTTPLFILFLTLFGVWMIQESFQDSLGKEAERCMVENQMFQNSYELTRHGLTKEQLARASVRSIVETFHRGAHGLEKCARIYDADRTVIYEDNALKVEHQLWKSLEDPGNEEDYNTGRQIVAQDGAYYVAVLGRMDDGTWIETLQNVTAVFQEREDLYDRYRIGMLAVSLITGFLTLFVLVRVMRNMQKLSSATRQYALGRYDMRVSIRSDDEVGHLADDFNWMANVMGGQMEQLQNEVRRQEEFTAAFAHELKTPLTSIIGYADTIRSMELTQEENDMCADYIFRQGKRLQTLSYKLLEMAMAGGGKLDYREIRVGDLFREAAQTAEQGLRQKELTLFTEQEEGVIWGDRDLLGSLLINLIDNAGKASSPGGRIWLTGKRLPGGYSITVEDEGKGISQEELSRITEAFYMVDKSRSRKEGGAGLGLALCKKILEMHQGSWHMESEPGKGMRIVILLGASPESERPERRRRPRPQRHRRG